MRATKEQGARHLMDLRLGEDQELLRKTARDVLASAAPLDALGRQEFDLGADDSRLWATMGSLGWLGLTLPADVGGSGGTLVDLQLLCEEMGRVLLPQSFLAVAVAATAALEHCADPHAKELLGQVAVGTTRVVLAIPEGPGPWRAESVGTRWDGERASGRKQFVPAAGKADVLVIAATDPAGGIELVAVDPRDPGVTLAPLPAMDGQFLSDITLEGVPGTVLGGDWDAVEHALTRVAPMHAGWCAGGAKRLLEDTVEYVTGRYQFGVPIGSFQAVQHRLADCDISVAEAETLARCAAALLDERSPAARRMASTAFLRATQAFVTVARSCHQVWGGIGFCTEAHVHHFSRRAKVAQHLWGGPPHHLAVVAEELRHAPLVRDRYVGNDPQALEHR